MAPEHNWCSGFVSIMIVGWVAAPAAVGVGGYTFEYFSGRAGPELILAAHPSLGMVCSAAPPSPPWGSWRLQPLRPRFGWAPQMPMASLGRPSNPGAAELFATLLPSSSSLIGFARCGQIIPDYCEHGPIE